MKSFWLLPPIIIVLACALWLSADPLDKATRPEALDNPTASNEVSQALDASTTPVIGTVSVDPRLVTINTPTAVTVAAHIADPRLVAGSVNLLRLNASSGPTVLGAMKDDGTNGDAIAGDRTFTLRVMMNVPTTGTVHLQISAAFAGMLRRVTSMSVSVDAGMRFTSNRGGYSLTVPSAFAPQVNTRAIDPNDPLNPIELVSFTGYVTESGSIEGYYVQVWRPAVPATLGDWVATNDELLFTQDRVTAQTTVAGYPAMQVRSASRARMSVYVLANNSMYKLSWPAYTPDNSTGLSAFAAFFSTWQPR